LQRLPHVDDGGAVRGSWRTLMRDCQIADDTPTYAERHN